MCGCVERVCVQACIHMLAVAILVHACDSSSAMPAVVGDKFTKRWRVKHDGKAGETTGPWILQNVDISLNQVEGHRFKEKWHGMKTEPHGDNTVHTKQWYNTHTGKKGGVWELEHFAVDFKHANGPCIWETWRCIKAAPEATHSGGSTTVPTSAAPQDS